jgi:hypothetical protein
MFTGELMDCANAIADELNDKDSEKYKYGVEFM